MAPSSAPNPSSKECTDKQIEHILFVIVLVVLANVAMILLHALGSLRRQSSHTLLHNIIIGIDTQSYLLVSYTIGRMNSYVNHCYVVDFAVWAVFMLLLLGSTDNLTACRLNDIDNWKSIFVKHLLKGLLVVYIVVYISLLETSDFFPYLYPLAAILLVGFLKGYVRIASMRMASKSCLANNMKVIAEYMQREDLNPQGSFDPVTMEGYKYLVDGEKYYIKSPRSMPQNEEEGSKVITVEQIWRCTGNLLHLERGNLFKDLCLSMALSKMLNRRFAGFKLSEASLQKTHDFVFNGLLSGDKPYQRPFRVIEEELVFVHDIYYTRYSYFYQKARYLALCLPIIMFGFCSWLTYEIVVSGRHQYSDKMFSLTIFITVVLAFLEVYQLYLYVASGWFKVALIQSYVTTPYLQRSCRFYEMGIGLLLRLKGFRPWKNRLGQYSILHEVGHKGRVRNCLHYATLHLMDKKVKKGRNKSVKLSENVKKAVVESLLRSNGDLTNGVTSLKNNGVDGHIPAWACDATATDGSITRTILFWHIATILCKHQLDSQVKKEADARREEMVTTATTLSQYCMHLLAFAPDLLPDHSSISESILDHAIEEAGEILKGCKKENWCDKLLRHTTDIGDGDGDEAQLFVKKGIKLARHLIENIEDPILRWKVISEFWAEMMLYVSPSDNARAHLDALARGGEFITHLWALLTHAGLLNREPTGP